MFRIFYKNQVRDKIIQYDNMIKQIIKITGLIVNTCVITYVLGCFWYRMVDRIYLGEGEETFITEHFLTDEILRVEDIPVGERLVFSVYFILTTLSTVGYGDFYPVSNLEKIVGSFVMFCGVTFFSVVMNEFIDIILQIKGDN
jgi:hypothetical protein